MTVTKMRLNCGCGYSTHSITEAEEHASKMKHNMDGFVNLIVEKTKAKPTIKEEK